jgi:phenylacetate-CoA ligase
MIFNEEMECMAPARLKELQSQRLVTLVRTLYDQNPVYRRKLNEAGVSPRAVKGIEDIPKLPFTVKEDLRDTYPFGILSRPIKEIAEIHVSSGTSGTPTVVGYTRDDIALWSDVMARALACAGAVPGDMIHIMYGYGLFTGGLGFHYGAMELGLTIIPSSAGQTQRQLQIMKDFKPRILACTPSYALFIAETAKEMGMNPREGSYKIGLFGAEPWSESMRREIEEAWDMIATDVYGLSEIIGPGVAQECSYKNGLHVFSDVFYPEVLDVKTGAPCAEGQAGELVITTLTKQGIPLLRYKTRDIVSLTTEPCPCGRTSPRMSKVCGRTDDMIIVRGINVFPSQVEHVLLSIEGIQPYYQLVVDRKVHDLDELEILVEVEEPLFSDKIKGLAELEKKVKKEIEGVLGIGVKVRLVEPKTIERSMGKAKRVVDKRSLT